MPGTPAATTLPRLPGDLDPDRTPIATIQGGVTVLLSTGSAAHLEAGLNLCLDHLLHPGPVVVPA